MTSTKRRFTSRIFHQRPDTFPIRKIQALSVSLQNLAVLPAALAVSLLEQHFPEYRHHGPVYKSQPGIIHPAPQMKEPDLLRNLPGKSLFHEASDIGNVVGIVRVCKPTGKQKHLFFG